MCGDFFIGTSVFLKYLRICYAIIRIIFYQAIVF